MRWLTIVVAALALAIAGAGCGGNDESSANTDTAVVTETTAEETTTEGTTTEETTTEETTTDASGGLASGDCLDLVNASAALGQAFASVGASGNPDVSTFFDQFDAPDEIKDDFQVLADAYAEYAAAVKDIGLEAGKTPTADQLQQFQQALAAIDQQAVTAASDRISVWADANCPSG